MLRVSPKFGLLAGLLACLTFCPATLAQNAATASQDKAKKLLGSLDRGHNLRIHPASVKFSKLISASYELSERQSLVLSTELVKLSDFYFKFMGRSTEPLWKFRAVPVTVSYEYALGNPDRFIVPIANAGLSYYFSYAREKVGAAAAALPVADPFEVAEQESFNNTFGMGFGAHAALGFRFNTSRRTFVSLQGRYRYVNAMAFFAKGSRAAGQFDAFDFAVSFGVKL